MSISRFAHRLYGSLAASIVLGVALVAVAGEGVPVKVGVDQKMEATLYKPAGAGPFPAVLVLHTSGGLRPADQRYASQLADLGYVCLVPDFFKAYDLSDTTRDRTFTVHAHAIYADFVNAITMLKKTPDVRPDRIGAVGFSTAAIGRFCLPRAATSRPASAITPP
jgi:dienelactone hydrolase